MYDAIIIGARCGGSPTGMLLAQKGYNVLVVDRMTFPSDTMSTHALTGDAPDRLRRWGLWEKLLATGPTRCEPNLTIWIDGQRFTMGFAGDDAPEGLFNIAPRRTYLDKILVDAAREAGAEVREGFSVEGLIWEGDTVVGVTGHSSDGTSTEERARIVVGADGKYSRVAREVKPQEYNTIPPRNCAYYSYYSGVEDATRMEFHGAAGGEGFAALFPTNDNTVCLAAGWPVEQFEEKRKDPEAAMDAAWAAIPSLAPRLKNKKREDRIMGWSGYTSYYRKPFGPGWALVGDAGYLKDPTLGQGINDCFRDAEYLSDAIDAGFSGRQELDAALAAYQQRRDMETGGIYALNDLMSQGFTAERLAILQQAMAMQAQMANA